MKTSTLLDLLHLTDTLRFSSEQTNFSQLQVGDLFVRQYDEREFLCMKVNVLPRSFGAISNVLFFDYQEECADDFFDVMGDDEVVLKFEGSASMTIVRG